jgi:hypothetical protein
MSLPTRSDASRTLYPAAAPALAAGAQTQELHIANNGLILLRGAHIVSVSGTTLTVSMEWGSAKYSWVVRTNASSSGYHNYGTRFLDHNGNPITLSQVESGGYVTVTGMLDSSANTPTLDADSVRSLQ